MTRPEDHEGSEFLQHEACPACGSKDNLARYTDGHGYCFTQGCGHYEPAEGDTPTPAQEKKDRPNLITDGDFSPLKKRGITQATCEKWGYQVADLNGKPVQVATYKNTFGQPVAQKLRFKGKDFAFIGDTKEAALFGQHLWRDGGKKLVITEGELDAMSLSQVQGHKWPVVSVPNGAQGAKKSLAKQIDWLRTFQEVILMFDNDDAGQQAAVECVGLFNDGRCKIAKLPLKDPNEMLVAGRTDELRNAVFEAKSARPDGIVTVDDIMEQALRDPEQGLPWWLPSLTEITYGRRTGECYGLGAGTGVGKTDFLTQQIQFDVYELEEKVGLFLLEQNPGETVKRVVGKKVGKLFHIPSDGDNWSTKELTSAVEALRDLDRVRLYDNFGSSDWGVISNHIRYLSHAEGIRLFYIDHLTALATGGALDKESEREALERIMSELASLAKELDVIIHFVSHLATPDGKPHEEGGRVQIRNFKGSRAIGFWSHFMFGLERNQQADDPDEAGETTLRVLKDRYTGQSTGKTITLGYDSSTGRLYEADGMFAPDDGEPPF